MKTEEMSVADRVGLRDIRVQRRMTQEQFAEALDISVDFLSLVERGISAPSFETLDKISRRLRIPMSLRLCDGPRISGP